MKEEEEKEKADEKRGRRGGRRGEVRGGGRKEIEVVYIDVIHNEDDVRMTEQ